MSASTTTTRTPRVPVHPVPGPIARWGLVCLAAALTACTPAGDSRQPSAPPPNGATTSTTPSGGEPPCTPSVTEISAPPAGYRLVGEDVAVPSAAVLSAEESGEADPAARLFAKWGLVVRADRVVDLRIAPGWEGRARVGWGAATTPAATATVHACAPEGGQARWLAFVGGTWVARAGCVPVIVTSNGQDHRVDLGIGVACATTTP
ncbi:hypothetical protein [Micromonospora zamorensis]|uniref:hypothetical protein n=1 Tax=Micromonospora zamorensis TaxID=709883 RepID=UPI0033AA23B3